MLPWPLPPPPLLSFSISVELLCSVLLLQSLCLYLLAFICFIYIYSLYLNKSSIVIIRFYCSTSKAFALTHEAERSRGKRNHIPEQLQVFQGILHLFSSFSMCFPRLEDWSVNFQVFQNTWENPRLTLWAIIGSRSEEWLPHYGEQWNCILQHTHSLSLISLIKDKEWRKTLITKFLLTLENKRVTNYSTCAKPLTRS